MKNRKKNKKNEEIEKDSELFLWLFKPDLIENVTLELSWKNSWKEIIRKFLKCLEQKHNQSI